MNKDTVDTFDDVRHDGTEEREDGWYYSTCSCGWKSRPMTSSEAAEAEFDAHF